MLQRIAQELSMLGIAVLMGGVVIAGDFGGGGFQVAAAECRCTNPDGGLGDSTCIDGTKHLCDIDEKNLCAWIATGEEC